MIGPSSSHTAGAAKIGLYTRAAFGKDPTEVIITLYGSFAKTYKGHGTDVALIGGLMNFQADDPRIPKAKDYASRKGMNITFIESDEQSSHPNTVKLQLFNGNEELVVVGKSIGGGNIQIVEHSLINNNRIRSINSEFKEKNMNINEEYPLFQSIQQLLALAKKKKVTVSELMVQLEMKATGLSRENIRQLMEANLEVMDKAIEQGMHGVKSSTGLTGGDAVKLKKYIESGKGLSGDVILESVAKAIATNEVNASMGIVCATPTAGSAGTVPGVLYGLVDKLQLTRDQKIDFLFCAGAFGLVIANNASISGAEGGCQAEVGSASGMAAAAAVEVAGGSPVQSAHACAIAIKNLLGLVCDPVAGLVEIPCIKRNAAGSSNALIAADMALAGVISEIPCDEVIETMDRVGRWMPAELRETAEGGLAVTPTAKQIQERIFGKCNSCIKA